LTSFYTEQKPEAVGTSFKYVSVNGGENPQNLSQSGAEAALDVQFAFGLAYPIPVSLFRSL
jgi:tripeptidyl-peptidase-1